MRLQRRFVATRTQIAKTLDSTTPIFADDAKDVRKAYKGIESEMAKSEKQSGSPYGRSSRR